MVFVAISFGTITMIVGMVVAYSNANEERMTTATIMLAGVSIISVLIVVMVAVAMFRALSSL